MTQVLLIDNDRLTRAELRTTLPWEKYDMRVIGEASNGEEGLQFLETNAVDLVMVDFTMPGMDGLSFIRKCRDSHPDVQYVVMSCQEKFEYIQEALRLGVIEYASKIKLSGEDRDAVFERIARTLHKRKGVAQDKKGYEDAREIEEILPKPLWLADDLCFSLLCRRIRENKYRPQRLEIAVRESVARLEAIAKVRFPDMESFGDTDGAIEYLVRCRKHAAVSAQERPETMENRLLLLARRINAAYAEDIDVSRLADEAGFSRSYLSSCFSRYFAMTINGFIRRKRVYESILFMKSGCYTLSDIALMVGYDSYQYFKKVFLEIMGETPRAWNERNRRG